MVNESPIRYLYMICLAIKYHLENPLYILALKFDFSLYLYTELFSIRRLI